MRKTRAERLATAKTKRDAAAPPVDTADLVRQAAQESQQLRENIAQRNEARTRRKLEAVKASLRTKALLRLYNKPHLLTAIESLSSLLSEETHEFLVNVAGGLRVDADLDVGTWQTLALDHARGVHRSSTVPFLTILTSESVNQKAVADAVDTLVDDAIADALESDAEAPPASETKA